MYSITRKINLHKYNGSQYESLDISIEGDDLTKISQEIDEFIITYIKDLPRQMAQFEQAKKQAQPFVSEGELKKF